MSCSGSREDTWQQVFDTLQAKGSGHRKNEGRRSYLLSGLLQCSQCGGSMSANARPDGSHFYACKPRTGQKGKAGCGKVTCSGRAVEALIEAAMQQRMAISSLTVHEENTWPDGEELAATKAQMRALMPQLVEAEGQARQLLNAEFTRLSDRVEGLQSERARWVFQHCRSVRHAKVGPEEWDDMTVDKRRAYVEEEITAIVVRPAAQRSNRFDYTRLSIAWRTDEPPAD